MSSNETQEEFVLGPLKQLLDDPDITEIMVNGTANIYIEKRGKLIETDLSFETEDDILNTINSIIKPLGRHISENAPIVDGRLSDGTRINAVIRPVALTGPTLTLRKFSFPQMTVENLLEYGSWTEKVVEFLKACIEARLNLVLSGNTSSGKTTVFNVLSEFIPEDERIVTVETTAELMLRHKHLVILETRPPDKDGRGEINIANLIMNATRMRPDRIISGEVRGAEAWDMLQVMTSGYDGSMFTTHAIDVADTLDRIELWCTAATNLPLLQIRGKIAQGINLIVHQHRLQDGTRKIIEISEVVGLKNNNIETRTIMQYVRTGEVDGKLTGESRFTGYIPTFAKRLNLPEKFFAG